MQNRNVNVLMRLFYEIVPFLSMLSGQTFIFHGFLQFERLLFISFTNKIVQVHRFLIEGFIMFFSERKGGPPKNGLVQDFPVGCSIYGNT